LSSLADSHANVLGWIQMAVTWSAFALFLLALISL